MQRIPVHEAVQLIVNHLLARARDDNNQAAGLARHGTPHEARYVALRAEQYESAALLVQLFCQDALHDLILCLGARQGHLFGRLDHLLNHAEEVTHDPTNRPLADEAKVVSVVLEILNAVVHDLRYQAATGDNPLALALQQLGQGAIQTNTQVRLAQLGHCPKCLADWHEGIGAGRAAKLMLYTLRPATGGGGWTCGYCGLTLRRPT